jgi:phosphoribosyl 1,2-cyclic phosphodiesterase
VLRVTVLGSGSRGNAIVVDGSQGTVLVDCGFAARTLHKRLTAAARVPDEIAAVLLTHEHVDHACGVAVASARWGWPVHASAATLAAIEPTTGRRPLHQVPITDAVHRIAGFSISHCAVPHDAADCRAYVLTDDASGARVGVVLDCGDVPATLPAFLSRCDLLVLESNHCPTMLANGPYPWMLKQRIRGGHGHLSNAHSARVLREVVHRGLRGVVLAHLSETNNTPAVALASAREALAQAGWHADAVWAAPQREPHAPITATGSLAPPAQYALGL